jgi:hypothetical protein
MMPQWVAPLGLQVYRNLDMEPPYFYVNHANDAGLSPGGTFHAGILRAPEVS